MANDPQTQEQKSSIVALCHQGPGWVFIQQKLIDIRALLALGTINQGLVRKI